MLLPWTGCQISRRTAGSRSRRAGEAAYACRRCSEECCCLLSLVLCVVCACRPRSWVCHCQSRPEQPRQQAGDGAASTCGRQKPSAKPCASVPGCVCTRCGCPGSWVLQQCAPHTATSRSFSAGGAGVGEVWTAGSSRASGRLNNMMRASSQL